ncbi:MAG: SPOR domain-containing protein [Candidatus Krumholzibacteriota bacterium]|nr:SPOR domain-containing protein [Candidatus Krumholzibacteriota bacterium]
MGDEEYGNVEDGLSGPCGGGGYSIFLDEKEMYAFMEEGDYSSSRNLDHFRNVEESIEKRMVEGEGFSVLAMSMLESRIARDFSVLQIGHLLSKNGKRVIIVDADFLSPGMNGLSGDIEDHGFLDLLLYGSSLKSVMKPTGIDGVHIAGPGSFPVSRTVPFALKEFGKIKDYLSSKSDIVIYCSTLYTEDKAINPLRQYVDSVLLCCSIEEMEEGELQKVLKDIGPELPSPDLVCFCSGKETAAGEEAEIEDEKIIDLEPESEILDPESPDEEIKPEFIEKSDEIDSVSRKENRRINVPRLAIIIISTLIVIFIIWWLTIDKSVQEKEGTDRMSELVLKQQDAREMAQKDDQEPAGEKVAEEGDKVETGAVSSGQDAGMSTEGSGLQTADVPDDQKPETRVDDSPDEKATPGEVTIAPEGTYYSVHIASFLDIGRAGTESDYFEKKNYDVRIMEVELKGRTWFRVYIGEFRTKEEAEAMRTELLSFRRIAEARVMNVKYN